MQEYYRRLMILDQENKTRLMPQGQAREGRLMWECEEDPQRKDTKSHHNDLNLLHVGGSAAISIELHIRSLIVPIPPSTESNKPGKYPAKTHARKVKDELKATSGLVFLIGQREKEWKDTDTEMPFRQRRFAFYLSGANFPGITVTYDIAKDDLILWVPVRSPYKELWNGTVPSIKECLERYDVDSVRDIVDMKVYLEKTLDPRNNHPTAYVLHRDERPPPLDWEGAGDHLNIDDLLLLPAMSKARVVKTAFEITQIRKAVEISSKAHCEVLKHIKRLKNEAQVESIFLSKCRDLGAKHQAYPPIAGSGPNASVLHYSANDQDFGDRQLMVLDAGAEFNCYASDITRTFPLGGRFTKEAEEIYQIVLNMQNECIEMIRPGRSWHDVSQKALQVAQQGLLNIGILQKGPSGELPTDRATGLFFPHGLGHLVGLDTHDVISSAGVRNSAEMCLGTIFGGKHQKSDFLTVDGGSSVDQDKRALAELKEGMVITCEPGLYFNRAYIKFTLERSADLGQYVNKESLKAYYPVGGCRIEDCILVTKDGFENLTTAPKADDMIKLINGEE